MTQQSSLVADLRAAGYKVELVPVLIGHSGTIYTFHTLDNMKQLGISTYHARKCALKMHVDAINHLRSIDKTRRHLKPNPTQPQTTATPSQTLATNEVHTSNHLEQQPKSGAPTRGTGPLFAKHHVLCEEGVLSFGRSLRRSDSI